MDNFSPLDLLQRPRRNRKSPAIRYLTQETDLSAHNLVAPFFVIEGTGRCEPIDHLPLINRLSIDHLVREAEVLHASGIQAIALFPCINPSLKTKHGEHSYNPDNLVCRCIRKLKQELPSMAIIADVALDPYTNHGHDGILDADGFVDNDQTVAILQKQALALASSGCDIVAPSDMMDGRIKAIRKTLDKYNLQNTSILAYSVKYASHFYAPFRNALQSSLTEGDKKTYQMNPANKREALREALLDIEEGADMLLVKPALPYLDIVDLLKRNTVLPIGAYHVSGEYAMVMAADQKGYLKASDIFFESLLSIRRAGASFIFTYAYKHILNVLN
ncbi:porphobilinogen synthase [Candidatus Aerophobetes bacterium]|uniref:Delta-aminolevulinic acid dehydratase n=1 Tax=Aerophobetes bacterium TaxID=2030807 RepID=A0A2A4WZS5_UNCAE|nr:MAG: porphobilinogen synthase [Candidatus Aerophobetes bacterium]